jgi:LysR family transcriptional activator of nhaA
VPPSGRRYSLRARTLHEYAAVPDLYEEFFAVTVRRQYRHPRLRAALHRSSDDVLAMSE